MTQIEDIMNGMRDALVLDGVGIWREDPSTYTAHEVGITYRRTPKSPDRVLVLTPYGTDDPLPLYNRVTLVQVKVRGSTKPLDAEKLSEKAFQALHFRHHETWGATRIARIRRVSSGDLGVDENDRPTLSDNYEITTQQRREYQL